MQVYGKRSGASDKKKGDNESKTLLSEQIGGVNDDISCILYTKATCFIAYTNNGNVEGKVIPVTMDLVQVEIYQEGNFVQHHSSFLEYPAEYSTSTELNKRLVRK